MLGELVVGVNVVDPLTYGGVAALLLVVTIVAGLVPARRAVDIDPLTARGNDSVSPSAIRLDRCAPRGGPG